MIVQLIVELGLETFHFVILSQVLTDFCVAMLIVGDDNFTGVGGCDSCFTVVFS